MDYGVTEEPLTKKQKKIIFWLLLLCLMFFSSVLCIQFKNFNSLLWVFKYLSLPCLLIALFIFSRMDKEKLVKNLHLQPPLKGSRSLKMITFIIAMWFVLIIFCVGPVEWFIVANFKEHFVVSGVIKGTYASYKWPSVILGYELNPTSIGQPIFIRLNRFQRDEYRNGET